jgi:hypothetical protein
MEVLLQEWLGGREGLTTDPTSPRLRRTRDTECTEWGVLTNAMKRYVYVISAAGRISYGAPSGYHDDCVIALALANHRRWETESVGRMMTVGGGGRRPAGSQSHRGILLG